MVVYQSVLNCPEPVVLSGREFEKMEGMPVFTINALQDSIGSVVGCAVASKLL